MNNHLLIVGITIVLLLGVGLSGCINNGDKNLETTPLDTFSLKIDDFPEGYIKWSEDYNQSVDTTLFGVTPVEVYGVTFVFENPENNTVFPAVALSISKFNSSDAANVTLYNLSAQMSNSLKGSMNRITPQNVEKIGDNSIYELFEGSMGEYYGYQNATWSFVYFRIENILVYLLLQGIPDWELDYINLTINYAKIIEGRINASLE